ncbi:hypothetical protein HETIRDRAFT_451235 [Heterobasidion irregulare TC 32-1]|uniref:Uncharacterized protein n=1 Tax=Heterobasidion irregulare (strain TC 32-1) TaxID=747525 RepID=W4K7W6_HETIT|nr:uncharacterized protein HETIRDRAFT_451235 [Heterobasidion irregulare TC 32-1]ETW81445.1 hypothetical protein HETIRDRAFT_451235 [Heterobasidion irregulare TC 32-1]
MAPAYTPASNRKRPQSVHICTRTRHLATRDPYLPRVTATPSGLSQPKGARPESPDPPHTTPRYNPEPGVPVSPDRACTPPRGTKIRSRAISSLPSVCASLERREPTAPRPHVVIQRRRTYARVRSLAARHSQPASPPMRCTPRPIPPAAWPPPGHIRARRTSRA